MTKETKENGITLIPLILTIIVLMILSAVTIGAITNEGGIFEKALEAKNKYNNEKVLL